MKRFCTALPYVIATVILIGATCHADAGGPPVSTQPELLRYLQRPVTLTWRGAPIHSSLNRLGNLYQIAVVVDRRVDPETELNLSVQQSAFLRVLVAAAVQSKLHVEVVGPCVYVGPEESTRLGPILLEIANQKIKSLPRRQRQRWQSRHSVQFSRLDEPRKIIEQSLKASRIPLVNGKKIPHDLWRAQQWPQQTAAETLTLVLLGFDMAFDVTETGGCRIRPIDRTARISHVHRSTLRSRSQRSALEKEFPEAVWSPDGIELDADLVTHANLRERIRQTRTAKSDAMTNAPRSDDATLPRSYSIEIKNQPLQPIAIGILERLNMKVEFDKSIPAETLHQRISFKVANGTRDELLTAMLRESGLQFTIEGDTVRIHP